LATGAYSASALQPGEYEVSAQAAGFKRVARDAIVQTGTTTTVDLTIELGELRDTVTVTAALPLIRHDHYQLGGVITRGQN
jgi:hypothetical protein